MKSIIVILFLLTATFARVVAEPLRVITTLNYLKYLTEQVGGSDVEVTALANPRQDPHLVTPTPRMNQIANNADLFIENGLSLDLWAKNVLDASGNPNIQPGTNGHLIATINVPVKELPLDVSRAWGDVHPQGNPHIWLDPLNVKIIAENIAERLKLLNPAISKIIDVRVAEFKLRINRAMYGEVLLNAVGKRAADILARKLRNGDLEPWLKERHLENKLGGWLSRARVIDGMKIISYHKTYVYFAERFGMNMVAELEEKPGIPPPPQHRDAIVETIKRDNIKVILNDNFYSREAADYVASKTPAKVVVTYIDVGATESIDSYEKLIDYLLGEIIQAAS